MRYKSIKIFNKINIIYIFLLLSNINNINICCLTCCIRPCIQNFLFDSYNNPTSIFKTNVNKNIDVDIKLNDKKINENTNINVNIYKNENKYGICHIYFKIDNTIPCILLHKEDGNEKNLLVAYHGMGVCIQDSYIDFRNKDILEEYDILIPELPGYPYNCEGDYSIQTQHTQAEKIINFSKEYYYCKNNKILCHSLGCYFGILLAAKDAELSKKKEENVFKKLIIACPFYSEKTATKKSISKHKDGIIEIFHQKGEKCKANCIKIFMPIIKQLLKCCYISKFCNDIIEKVSCDIDIYYSPNDDIVYPKDSFTLYDIKSKQKKKSKYEGTVRIFPILGIQDEHLSTNKSIYETYKKFTDENTDMFKVYNNEKDFLDNLNKYCINNVYKKEYSLPIIDKDSHNSFYHIKDVKCCSIYQKISVLFQ